MLTLHADPDCRACRRLVEKLGGLPLAHRIDESDSGRAEAAHTLDDGDQRVCGHEQIERRIDETWEQLQRSQRYQSDLCLHYPDEDEKDWRC